jgi:hypothetical protein
VTGPAGVLPGDFGLKRESGPGGLAITVAQVLDEWAQGHWRKAERDAQFDHALIVESVDPDGTVHAVEAWPGGARRNTYRVDDPSMVWSSGRYDLTVDQQAGIVGWAVAHLHARYSALAYVRQAVVRLHLPFGRAWLARQIVARKEYLCSQYVDCAYAAVGVRLFTDGRAPYDVAPSDLADLLSA